MNDIEKIAEVYQPLFDLMSRDHGLTLLKSEMDDIMEACEEVNERWNKAFNSCDVEGCEEQRATGGGAWKDSGYWCLCSKHYIMAFQGEPQPKMKDSAIARESSRDSNGILPSLQIK